jgi:zinc protease
MRKLILWLFLVNIAYAANYESLVKIDSWKDEKTKIPVYLVARHENPIVDIAIVYNAGSANVKHQEVAIMTNQLLLTGVAGYDYKSFRDALDSVGTIIRSSVTKDKALVQIRSLVEEKKLAKTLLLTGKVLSRPTFSDKQIAIIKQLAVANLLQSENNPYYLASKNLKKLIYGKHPYGFSSSVNGYKSVKRKDLLKFFKQYYTRQNAKILIVGDVDLAKAKTIAAKIANNILPGTVINNAQKKPDNRGVKNLKIDFNAKQATILFGQSAVDKDFANIAYLDLGNYILGRGMDSDLFVEIREKNGWAYFINSYFSIGKHGGHFVVATQTQNKNIKEIMHKIDQVISNFLQKGPSEQQLQRAKLKITRGVYEMMSSNQYLLDFLVDMSSNDRSLDYLDKYMQQVKNAKTIDVKRVMQSVLGQMSIVVVGPKDVQPFQVVDKKV